MLHLQPLKPPSLIRPPKLGLGLFGQGEEECDVAASSGVSIPALLKLLEPVLADGLKHPVAFLALSCLRCHKCPASHKHRKPLEELALGLAKQLVTPVQRPLEGLVPRRGHPVAPGQELEGVLEPLSDLLRGEHPYPRAGQLYG